MRQSRISIDSWNGKPGGVPQRPLVRIDVATACLGDPWNQWCPGHNQLAARGIGSPHGYTRYRHPRLPKMVHSRSARKTPAEQTRSLLRVT